MKSNFKNAEIIKESSKFAIKFANFVFILGVFFSILLVLFSLYKKFNHLEYVVSNFYFLFFFFGIFTTILFYLGLRMLRDELKINISILLVTLVISVLGFEIYLKYFHQQMLEKKKVESQKIILEKIGNSYDTRTPKEVIKDLIELGKNAYPKFSPTLEFITRFNTSKGKIYPLGDISNGTTILNNELGYYPVIETDEHGFNNPKGLYKENKVDIILTGDSFTEGYSVQMNESMSAVLNELGFRAISLGKGSNGPLTELAALKEYAEPLKPKIILWIYFINDLSDLIKEMKSPVLQKYLNQNDFSQNLISRQEEIDRFLIDFYKEDLNFSNNMGLGIKWQNFLNILELKKIRTRLKLISNHQSHKYKAIFKKILKNSKQMVSRWGGKIYFVYLPSSEMYSTNFQNECKNPGKFSQKLKYCDPNREFVLNTVNELDIPIIDTHKEVFIHHPEPMSLFPFKMHGGHYNAEGYRLVAESIFNRLKSDGVTALESTN